MPTTDFEIMNRRILLVDDQETIHEDFRKVLATSDSGELNALAQGLFDDGFHAPDAPDTAFELDSVYQGRDAVSRVVAAQEAGTPYAVAFVDMRMPPGWDGARTVRELWAVDPDLEVVICTAYSDQSWRDLASEPGQRHKLLLLKKPFDPLEVSQLALALTEKWSNGRRAALKSDELEALVALRTEELRRATQHKVDFLTLLNHEVRTPLNAILGYTQLLSMEISETPDEEQQKALDEIANAGTRLLDLFGDMIDVVQSASGTLPLSKVPLNATAWAQSAVARFASLSKKIRPVLCVESGEAQVYVDPERCEQVLFNLLDNASKNTPASGTITVHVSNATKPGFLKISVVDSGCGIPPEESERLFDQFEKTSESMRQQIGGTGIGLALSKRIVELHGGEIGVESALDKGTTVWFTLPSSG